MIISTSELVAVLASLGLSTTLLRPTCPVSRSSPFSFLLASIPSPPKTYSFSEETYGIVMANAAHLDAAIVHSRDNAFDYFGFKTLERSYLLRIEGLIVERPQVFSQHRPSKANFIFYKSHHHPASPYACVRRHPQGANPSFLPPLCSPPLHPLAINLCSLI
jgi:hypothetical protein